MSFSRRIPHFRINLLNTTLTNLVEYSLPTTCLRVHHPFSTQSYGTEGRVFNGICGLWLWLSPYVDNGIWAQRLYNNDITMSLSDDDDDDNAYSKMI
jgi:hypothetical protein